MEYTKQSIQAELNCHPDASPFWDTPKGQEVLEAAAQMKLKATNTNKERCEIFAAAKRDAAYPQRGMRAA